MKVNNLSLQGRYYADLEKQRELREFKDSLLHFLGELFWLALLGFALGIYIKEVINWLS